MHMSSLCNELDQKIGSEEMMKTQYRHRTYSEETGYSESTLVTTTRNIRMEFERNSHDTTVWIPVRMETVIYQNRSDSEDDRTRSITKNNQIKSELETENEKKIYEIAEKLVDYRMELWMTSGIHVFDEMSYQYAASFSPDDGLRNQAKNCRDTGWKYLRTIPVFDSFATKDHRYMKKKPRSFCEFCYNKASERRWKSHQCHDETGKVICPELFKLECGICGATGEYAHTKRYCPRGQRRAQKYIELKILNGQIGQGK